MKLSIALKLLLVLLLMVASSVSFITIITLEIYKNSLKQELFEKSEQASHEAKNGLVELFLHNERLVNLVSKTHEVIHAEDSQAVSDYLSSHQDFWFENVIEIFDKNQKRVAYSGGFGLDMERYLSSPNLSIISSAEMLKSSSIYVLSDEVFAIKSAAPIVDMGTFEVRGVTTATHPINNHTSRQLKNRTGADVILWKADGGLISHSFNDDNPAYNQEFFSSLILQFLASKEEGMRDLVSFGGQLMTSYFSPVTNANGETVAVLMTGYDIDVMEQSRKDTQQAIMYGAVVIFVLATLVALLLSRTLTGPICRLTSMTNQAIDGNLDVHSGISRGDEIGILAKNFDEMIRIIRLHIQELDKKVQERTQELEEKNKELEQLSITDRLTGLYNRRKLDEVMETEIHRAKRFKHLIGVIIVDVDHFKSVNDTHGHQAGDQVLIELAGILKEHTRETDTVGRWGGEEFLIICPETDLEGTAKLAELLRKKIKDYEFSVVKSKTASFGVTTYRSEDTIHAMINRADEALYLAKENGRNRVVAE